MSQEEDKVRELEHIKSVLMENGYPRALVEAWSRQKKGTTKGEEQDDVVGTVCLPHVKGLSEAIARILRKVQIWVVNKPENWKWSVMAGVKDRVEEVDRAGGVYGLDCKDCNLVYIGETGRSVKK